MSIKFDGFVDDAGSPIYYRECLAPATYTDFDAGEIITGCTSTKCLDDDATDQTIDIYDNYEGNVQVDTVLAGGAALLATPRLYALDQFRVSGTTTGDGGGYTLVGADDYELPDLRSDFEDNLFSTPPDIGHDDH